MGPTRRGMGGVRAPHGPEHNLIQRPDLIARLAQRFGMRQAHITPTMEDSVQPVAIVEDLTIRDSAALRRGYFEGYARGDGTRAPSVVLRVPDGMFCRFPLLRVSTLPSASGRVDLERGTGSVTQSVPFTAGVNSDLRFPIATEGGPLEVSAGASQSIGGAVLIGRWQAFGGIPWPIELDGLELDGLGTLRFAMDGNLIDDQISVHGIWELEADT